MQIGRVRGRQINGVAKRRRSAVRISAEFNAQSSGAGRPMASGGQDLAEERDHGCLAVGARHTGDICRLISEEARRHESVLAAWIVVGDDGDRGLWRLDSGARRRQDRRRPAFQGVGNESPAVILRAGDRGKQITRMHLSGIACNT